MAAPDLEAAVRAAQLYAGCDGKVRIKDAQKLYTRLQRAVERVARKRGMDVSNAHEQIMAEALRRGVVCPVPGKDI